MFLNHFNNVLFSFLNLENRLFGLTSQLNIFIFEKNEKLIAVIIRLKLLLFASSDCVIQLKIFYLRPHIAAKYKCRYSCLKNVINISLVNHSGMFLKTTVCKRNLFLEIFFSNLENILIIRNCYK